MTILKEPLNVKVIPASEPESRDSDVYFFWMLPADYMPGQAYQSPPWT